MTALFSWRNAGNLVGDRKVIAHFYTCGFSLPQIFCWGECCKLTEQEQREWYSGKEIADMFLGMKEDISQLRVEMRETKTLIRDYNGLRKRIDKCEERLDKGEGQEQGEETTVKLAWEKMGYIVGIAGLIIAGLALVIK